MTKEETTAQDILSNMSQINTVHIDNEQYYKISKSDTIRPFFMSIVSDSTIQMTKSRNLLK